MATTITRSSTEVLRLFRLEWGTPAYLDTMLVDVTGAGTPPTEASSMATWLNYGLIDVSNPAIQEGPPFVELVPANYTYNSGTARAESPVFTFDFSTFISTDFAEFTSTTVTHIIIGDIFGIDLPTTNPPCLVLTESPALTLTSSTTLSRTVQLYGQSL